MWCLNLFFPLFYSNLAALGLQPSKLADWSSSGPESKANGHGSSSTLPRMSSVSTTTAEQGREHRQGRWAYNLENQHMQWHAVLKWFGLNFYD